MSDILLYMHIDCSLSKHSRVFVQLCVMSNIYVITFMLQKTLGHETCIFIIIQWSRLYM